MSFGRKRIIFWLALAALNVSFFLVAETGVRLYFTSRVGSQILFYGTDWYRDQKELVETERRKRAAAAGEGKSVTIHRNDFGNYRAYSSDRDSYSKYLPNQTKRLSAAVSGEPITARINNQGYRGDDFEREKEPRTFRILALGGSSTFGYGVGDDETYPRRLEAELTRRLGGKARFEVINLGIPHSTSLNLVSMFLSEGADLDPDFVTLYTGANDGAIVERTHGGRAAALWLWLEDHFLLLKFAGHSVLTIWPSTHTWSDEYAERRSDVFLANLDIILEACRERGIQFVVATQQARSLVFDEDRTAREGITYQDEVKLVRRFIAARNRRPMEVWREAIRKTRYFEEDRPPGREAIPAVGHFSGLDKARVFLIHARLMDDLRAWSASRDVALVDVIEALDQDREQVFSWVHLTPEGNRMVASALADEILERLAQTRQNEALRPREPLPL